jgi:glycosyltransferase involved in cell wall biosynthesis
VEGVLVDDPLDLEAFSRQLSRLLNDQPYAERLGSAARNKVIKEYLPPRHLLEYAALIERYLPAA